MKSTIINKLNHLSIRHDELGQCLANNYGVDFDQNKFKEVSKEYSDLKPIVDLFKQYVQIGQEITITEELTNDPDPELKSLANLELLELKARQQQVEQELQVLLLPKDPRDHYNVFLEIRAGTGGNEAALFASDLCRMYCRYAESIKWKVEILNESFAEQGGYKEVILRIIGNGAFSRLKFESGVHRVQRVPITESQGRIHTSTCTVAILPELEAIENIEIYPADLKIDTYRASGAGGQHVNRTDSAVRITHLPTGIIVECQDDRSQHRNKAKALGLLQAKILAKEQEKQQQQIDSTRRNLVGNAERSERIRTYNFPQGRITDHRINLTVYNLVNILEGDLNVIIEPLIAEHQTDLLAEINNI